MTSRPHPSPRRSAAARLLSLYHRANSRRHAMARRVAGELPPVSAEPGPRVARHAAVTSYPLGEHRVWRLQPPGQRPDEEPGPLVVYFHGGAFINGFHAAHWEFLADLVRRTGCEVLAPEYPLTPPATADSTVDWCLEAYAAPAAAARQAGRRVVVAGDSAGGNLAVSVPRAAIQEGLTRPDALLLLSPWLDLGSTAPDAEQLDRADVMLAREPGMAAGRLYAGDRALDDPRVSPLFDDFADLPPVLSWCGDADQVVADQRRLADRAAARGWDVRVAEAPGMTHVWMLVGFLPEARAARRAIATAVLGD